MKSQSESPKLSDILDVLRRTPHDSARDTIELVHRALGMISENPEVLAFVRGKHVRSVDKAWGDNNRSFWAHLYPIPGTAPRPEVLLTLERSGAIEEFLGIFPNTDAALAALCAIGKYKRLP